LLSGRLSAETLVQASDFDEEGFFRSLHAARVRALLIGRKALVVLGLPLLTADYDFWLHREDIEPFNGAVEPFGLYPSHGPEEARRRGRYVLENDERVDVLVARTVTTFDGEVVHFYSLWERRREVSFLAELRLALPCLDDLILTKRFSSRPKDLEDIRLLELLRREMSE
jgi:hypothetical protein